MEELKKKLEQTKAYAKELERIIEAVDIHPHQRLIVNSLIGAAKERFDQYEKTEGAS